MTSRNHERWLPTTAEEIRARGWDAADVVFVTGDAYVDHPSFAMAVLGRVLESHGFRVAILPQPDWKSAEAWRALGRPRLFYAVSAGNMDSMINHYTANRKRRNDDAYSPGGRIGLRPDRPTPVYAQRCREAFPGVPVVIGGIEASLRRIAHFDYWSEQVRPSMLVVSKADLLAFGKGEATIVAIAQRLAAGEPVSALRDLRGVAYLLGAKEPLPEWPGRTLALPSLAEVARDRMAFARMTRAFHHETNPFNAGRLTQFHDDRMLVLNPPCLPIGEGEMDAIYDLRYTRRPHPRYREPIPAHTMIKDSVQIMRGCFGGCTFCSITMHEGRVIQSRSPRSILAEVKAIAAEPGFKGTISDLGGPTANMYRMRCTRPEVEAQCKRLSCIHPTVCKLLGTDHGPTIELMRQARAVPGVKRVHIASGIRMDLANRDDRYVNELVTHHVGGHLKVAPEHTSDRVLGLMKKPSHREFETFAGKFRRASERAGKEQYLVPYFIASHPGSTVADMIELAVFLKAHGYRPRQVQDFIPAPMDIATCMYHTGIDPLTMQPVETVTKLRDRQTQRALMQFFEPANWFAVHKALVEAGRRDLIGSGRQCLIPATPPPEALAARRREAQDATFVHAEDAGTRPTVGYRPGRSGARVRGRTTSVVSCAPMQTLTPVVRKDLAPTGALRVGINYGNFILATKDAATGESRGVAIDLANELAGRLGVRVEIVAYDSVAVMVEAAPSNTWDIAFLGSDPAREKLIDFTAAYLEIEATYLVAAGSPLRTAAEVDRAGVRVAAPSKANYELYLSRALKHAQLISTPGSEAAFTALRTGQADALAGLTQALLGLAGKLPGSRMLEGRFMAVQQSIGVPKGRAAGLAYLRGLVEEAKASGLVARAIARTGAQGVTVAPKAG